MKPIVSLLSILLTTLSSVSMANEFITYDDSKKSLSVSVEHEISMQDLLVTLGEKLSISVEAETALLPSVLFIPPLQNEPLDSAIAKLVYPYYFKVNGQLVDDDFFPRKLIVYSAWKNNEPRTVVFSSRLTRKQADELQVGGGDGQVMFRKRQTRDWKPGESTGSSTPFTFGNKDQWGFNHWIVPSNNPDLLNKHDGEVFFAYLWGKDNHTSALVRAYTKKQKIDGEEDVLTFYFDVIKGQIDSNGVTIIDYMTELTPPSNFGGKVGIKTNLQTSPDWLEYYGNNDSLPSGNYNVRRLRNLVRSDGWSDFEFVVKEVTEDESGEQKILNYNPSLLQTGYHLAYVTGGDKPFDNNFFAYCLIHSYEYAGVTKARVMVLDNLQPDNDSAGQIDNDYDVYVEPVILKAHLTIENIDFDNVVYPEYKDMFLLNSASEYQWHTISGKSWSSEFDIKQTSSDPVLSQKVMNVDPSTITEGYHLLFVRGGNNATTISGFEGTVVAHIYRNADNQLKAQFLELTASLGSNDIYINEVSPLKDAVVSQSTVLSEVLPSHMLYSPEDYTWDPVRLKLVPNGTEVSERYVEADPQNEGTIGQMLRVARDSYSVPEDERIPFIFVHGWQPGRVRIL